MLIDYDFSAVNKNGRKRNKAGLVISENEVVGALSVKSCVLRTLGTVVFNKDIIVNESVRAEFCIFGFENINWLQFG